MFAEMNLQDFSAETASVNSTPGGGSVSAYAGALSASLFEMAVRISYRNIEENIQKYMDVLEPLRLEAMALVDEDSRAFGEVMAAYALPRSTDEEKDFRRGRIQEALRKATGVPLETARCCSALMKMAAEIGAVCKESCVSDAASAFHLAEAGFKGALYNVAINLSSIKDGAFVEEMGAAVKDMEEWYESSHASIEALYRERLGLNIG